MSTSSGGVCEPGSSGCTDSVVAKSAPPTDTFIDNLSIQSLVSGENGKGKALHSYNRVISHLRSLKREHLTNPLGIPTVDQLADIGTKQYKNATAFWRAAAGALGDHPAIRAMQERVGVVNGRGSRKRDRDIEAAIQDEVTEDDAEDDDIDGTSVFNLALASLSVTEEMDRDFAEERLGQLTMENTRLNAERDGGYRRAIEACVWSGNGDVVVLELSEHKKGRRFVARSQETTRKKLS